MLFRCLLAITILSVPGNAETVAAMIRGVQPIAGNNWRVVFYGATSTGKGFDGSIDVSLDYTAAALNTAIKAQVISDVSSLYGLTVTADDITVFGGPFVDKQLNKGFKQPVPLLIGTDPPATCTLGERFFDTDAAAGQNLYGCTSEPGTWTLQGGGGASVPAGLVTFVVSGTCPTGWSEVAALNGKAIYGTVAANADVGDAIGSASVTPTTASISLTSAAQTFTGSALGTHLHGIGSYDNAVVSAGTPAGTNGTSTAAAQTFTGTPSTCVANHVHVQSVNSAATGGLNGYGLDTSTNTSSTSGYSTANPTGGSANCTPAGTNGTSSVGAQAFTGSALGTHDHTLSGSSEAISGGTPAGTNGTSAVTGTITMNSLVPQFSGIKAIFCSKD